MKSRRRRNGVALLGQTLCPIRASTPELETRWQDGSSQSNILLASTAKLERARHVCGIQLSRGRDHRSSPAKRFRRLVRDYADMLGGTDALRPIDRNLIRQVVVLQLRKEELEATMVAGQFRDDDSLIRISSEMRRVPDHR